ncbi:hypothetical protein AOA81_01520 [Methanomassiliicoccales archaeon RumEn M2]|nr:hypothetical protein AOA81_01520 [Methanomassiliicoccales archaeon RumEn M2]
MESQVLDRIQDGREQKVPIPCGDIIVEFSFHVSLAYVDSCPLFDEIPYVLRSSVPDHCVGGIDALISLSLKIHPEYVLVRLALHRKTGAYVPECHQLPYLRMEQGDSVMEGPQHIGGKSCYRILGIRGHGVPSDYSNLIVRERTDQIRKGVFIIKRIICIKEHDYLCPLAVQKQIYRGVLTLSSLLRYESQIRVFGEHTPYYFIRPVGTAAGYHDDLRY